LCFIGLVIGGLKGIVASPPVTWGEHVTSGDLHGVNPTITWQVNNQAMTECLCSDNSTCMKYTQYLKLVRVKRQPEISSSTKKQPGLDSIDGNKDHDSRKANVKYCPWAGFIIILTSLREHGAGRALQYPLWLALGYRRSSVEHEGDEKKANTTVTTGYVQSLATLFRRCLILISTSLDSQVTARRTITGGIVRQYTEKEITLTLRYVTLSWLAIYFLASKPIPVPNMAAKSITRSAAKTARKRMYFAAFFFVYILSLINCAACKNQ
jgi:hypothetical protein